jgi:hypothetical protein
LQFFCGSHNRCNRPVATRLRKLPKAAAPTCCINTYREFDVQNRFKGTAEYFTVSLPVGIDTNAQAVPGNMIKARF